MIEQAADLLKNIGVIFTEEQLDIIDHGILVEDALKNTDVISDGVFTYVFQDGVLKFIVPIGEEEQ